TKSKLVRLTAARQVTTAVPQPHVTRPRPTKTIVTKSHLPPRRNINRRPSPKHSNFPPKVTTVKVPQGNPQHALKDKGVIDSGCSRHMIGNMSYLPYFKEINGGYVAFGGNPKGGKITGKDLCKAFEKLMKDKFQMSSMGEITFFLGLQIKQKLDGIFISHDKYVAKILKKFGLTDGKSASTPIDTKNPLLKDPDGEDVDVYTNRSMIGSLMYLTSSRPDILFKFCACARF
nr:uncharacterized mitochondrial protein AtMg00810-like [Tanacetum cinerariifolium]